MRRLSAPVVNILFSDVQVAGPLEDVRQHVRDFTVLKTLADKTDVMVKDEIEWRTNALKSQSTAVRPLGFLWSDSLNRAAL